MDLDFKKYQATGNDFIIIGADQLPPVMSYSDIAKKICPRRIGIGADGIIIIESKGAERDYAMQYYNADGSGPIMCGNGARASLHYVHQYINKKEQYNFLAPDGHHQGLIDGNMVEITMQDADTIDTIEINSETAYLLNTGAPHLVIFDEITKGRDIKKIARPLRNKYDANVNFINQNKDGDWQIRTYERGVEDETLACGTGITASALVMVREKGQCFPIELEARGGKLKVREKAQKIWLSGEALQVYSGNILL